MGNDAGLFAGGEYDEEDREADAVWAAVDDHMDSRRRVAREARLKAQIEAHRASNPTITEQFADLKRKLAEVKAEEWEAIPEIGDTTLKARKRFQAFVPVPDTLLAAAAAEKGAAAAVVDGGATDLTALGEARGSVLALKLARMGDSVSGQSVVDPRGYLTSLAGLKTASDADVQDIKKARLLLKSVVASNPGHAPGWIAAARLEEVAGRLQAARTLALAGTDACPGSEDVWLEAARLQPPDAAKAVLARAVGALPASVPLWLAAAQAEAEPGRRQRVLRRALESAPTAVRLWKAAVEGCSEEDARVLLARAVECCPQHSELWLALARLEGADAARAVLNRARQALPADPAIWVAAAKLEEAAGGGARCAVLLERGVKSLAAHGCVLDRDAWLKEAEAAEAAGAPATAAAIVAATVGTGVEDADRKRTWLGDAAEVAKRGAPATARAILHHALAVFPAKKGVWLAAAELERSVGGDAALQALLGRATEHCPRSEVLWLMWAKSLWQQGALPAARAVLERAFAANPGAEAVALAALKMEFESGETARARAIAAKAVAACGADSPRVWQKAAAVERAEGATAAETALLEAGLAVHPRAHKLWLMLAQAAERGDPSGAAPRAVYARALKPDAAPDCPALWRAAARLEETLGAAGRARALLDTARLKLPACDELWAATVRLESRGGDSKAAATTLSRALQACPASGLLWAEAVALAPRPAKRAAAADALRRCEGSPAVLAAVAAVFEAEHKVDKARSWLQRATALAPDHGDSWARLYGFEARHGSAAALEGVAAACAAAAPRHGEWWARVAKRLENAGEAARALLPKVVASLLDDPAP